METDCVVVVDAVFLLVLDDVDEMEVDGDVDFEFVNLEDLEGDTDTVSDLVVLCETEIVCVTLGLLDSELELEELIVAVSVLETLGELESVVDDVDDFEFVVDGVSVLLVVELLEILDDVDRDSCDDWLPEVEMDAVSEGDFDVDSVNELIKVIVYVS